MKISTLNKKIILMWIKMYKRLPSRYSNKIKERKVGMRLESYLSPASDDFDKSFRRLVLSKYPRQRVVLVKSKHDKRLRIKEVIEFITTHKRSPSQLNRQEKRLKSIIDNYARPSNYLSYIPSFHQELKRLDRCLNSHIPCSYRACINNILGNNRLRKEKIRKD